MKTTRILTLLSCVTAAFLEAAVLYDGKPLASIVLADDAVQPARTAAQELNSWLGQTTDCYAWKTRTEPIQGLYPIYVGDSKFAREHGFDPDKLKSDGYFLKVTDEYMILAGRDYRGGPIVGIVPPYGPDTTWSPDLQLSEVGEMGTFNGVCRFLEKYLDIRFYMPGIIGTVHPQKLSKIEIPSVETTEAPSFEHRFTFTCVFGDAPKDALWCRRVGYGARTTMDINHSFDKLNYQQKNHPEYFALIDGKRDFTTLSCSQGGGNLCLSNPDTLKAFVNEIMFTFQRYPDLEVYPVCPNDGLFRICDCPECQAQLSPELGELGEFSNYIWKFVDKVAREVAKSKPQKKIACFAYEKYKVPPAFELSPNVSVMICYTRMSMLDPAYEKSNRELIAAWRKKCSRVYFWTYSISDYWHEWKCNPVCYPHLIARDIKANYDIGGIGEFIEAESWQQERDPHFDVRRIYEPGLMHLNAYVTAKCLWDANTDVDALLNEYYVKFYGDAADEMRQFWEKSEKLLVAHGKYTMGMDKPSDFFTSNDVREFTALLEKGRGKLKRWSQEGKRIDMIRREFMRGMGAIAFSDALKPVLSVKTLTKNCNIGDDIDQAPWTGTREFALTTMGGQQVEEPKTLVKAVADAEGMLFTIVCNEPKMDKLKMDCKLRDDSGCWEDDCIELFLQSTDNANTCHYIITAANVLFDSSIKDLRTPENKGWNSECKHNVTREKDRWILQVKVPWSDVGAVPGVYPSLRGNIFRSRYVNGKAEVFTFSPNPDSNGAFKDDKYFTSITFRKDLVF